MSDLNPKIKAYLSEADQKLFCKKILMVIQLGRSAVALRLEDLRVWQTEEQRKFRAWFGTIEEFSRFRMIHGLRAMKALFQNLACDDFLPYTAESMKTLGCLTEDVFGAVAAVCPVPGVTKIMIGSEFFELPLLRANGADRRVTLIHEVAHMPETFGTKGPGEIYGLKNVKRRVSPNPEDALKNSDCFAAYVLGFDDV